MSKNIEPSLKTIGQYLSLDEDAKFVIPEYQRAYSWSTGHCDKLWQDIKDYIESPSKDKYFFGTVIISCEKGDSEFHLIDGQQRTTTFLLLLKALLIRINAAIDGTANDEDSERLRRGLQNCRTRIMGILYRIEQDEVPYTSDYETDAAICEDSGILATRSINESENYKEELITILRSVTFSEAQSRVYQIPYKQKDNRYTNFFRNFKYFYEMAGDLYPSELNTFAKKITDECEIIEVKSWQVDQAISMFNSLNSDGMPLRDADIIAAKLYANANYAGKRDEFNGLWRELLDLSDDLDGIDSILLQHMYYERASRKEILSESGAVIVTTPGVRRYFTELNPVLLGQPVDLCDQMVGLASKWLSISDYPLVQVLLEFNKNAKLFLAGYLYRFGEGELTSDKVCIVLECLLRLFAILEVVDAGYSSSSFKTFLFRESVKLVDPNVEEDKIKADFDAHIQKHWGETRDSIRMSIIDCEKKQLVYLNELLFSREHDMPFSIGSKHDVEHIMPSSGKNLQAIRGDAGIESEEDFKNLVNKLGNKILLEANINRSIGNEWFRTKVSTTLEDKTGYIDSAYPIARALVGRFQRESKPYWTKNDIENATEKAASRIMVFLFGEE